MRWKILLAAYPQMISGYDAEKVIKIGQYLPKVAQFFDSQCIVSKHPRISLKIRLKHLCISRDTNEILSCYMS